MKRNLLILLMTMLGFASPAHAQSGPPTYVGIPSDRFNFVAAAQQQDQWCWAASVQMILNWYQVPVTQQMVVARTKGVLIDQGGSDADISSALSGWAVTASGVPVVIRSMEAPGLPPPQLLLSELGQGHPILLTFATGMYSGLAVVITAASYFPTPYGPQITSLILRDPWPSPDHIASAGRVEIAGPQLGNFTSMVRSYWLVSVGR